MVVLETYAPMGSSHQFNLKKAMAKLRKIHPNSGGIDIGSQEVFVAVENQLVKSFGTFTQDYQALIAYLTTHGVKRVAMESTGVYWVVLYDMLEQAGFEVWLVNPKETKSLPGRKTDVQDAEWILQLHSYGLLRKSFIPTGRIRELREYMRIREDHIQMGSSHIQRMQRALLQMNIQLPQVLSKLQGKSGQAIISAILAGERDPEKLVSLCHHSVRKNKRDQLIEALQGYYSDHHLFSLKQAYQCWQFYQQQIYHCDQQIDQLLAELTQELPEPKLGKPKAIKHHKPAIKELYKKVVQLLEGNDPTLMGGVSAYTLLKLIAELGVDLSHFPSEKHFVSWLGLSPSHHQSGKSKKRGKRKANTKAGQIFKLVAQSMLLSKHHAFGQFGRRLRAKKGPAIAIKATARKIAICYYNILTKGIEFVEKGIQNYQQKLQEQKLKSLQKHAESMGFQLTQNQIVT